MGSFVEVHSALGVYREPKFVVLHVTAIGLDTSSSDHPVDYIIAMPVLTLE